ncbi:MAG: M6 family metalloprotease domain-containing protein [Bacteroidales bacterium]|nr:M6 family metalloprotease domain-containing protein [Bacteroidales bacterium]
MRSIKIFSSAVLLLLACSLAVQAVPARPGSFKYTQPDGSVIVLRRVGDEFNHYTLNAAGQKVVRGADGFYRPVTETTASSNARANKARARRLIANAGRDRVRRVSQNMGEHHIPVILVAFSDQAFTVSDPKSKFTAMLNQDGYSYNGATGSVYNYFIDNSNNQYHPVFDVYGPVTLSSPMATYGALDEETDFDVAPELALFQAAKALDSSVDFSQYDGDKDGYVDMILFYYAGYNEAEGGPEDSIWPHQWSVASSSNQDIQNGNNFDGVHLDAYFCTSELNGYQGSTMCGIGTTCHEFSHSIGLPDFYDTDYGDSGSTYGENHGCAADPYSYSLMCSGSYNNDGRTPPYLSVEEKILLGWLPESSLQEFPGRGVMEIPPVQQNISYKTYTSTSGEYFVYECRSNTGWDKYLPGGPGLIVYHVDKSSTKVTIYNENGYETNVSAAELWSNWNETNQINENAKHPCYYIIPAKDQTRIAYKCYTGEYAGYPEDYDETKIPFPGTGSNTVTSYTPKDWKGVEGTITFSDIARTSSGSVSLRVNMASAELDYCVIDNPGNGSYNVGEQFDLNITAPEGNSPDSVLWYIDGEPVSSTSVILTPGVHTIEALLTFASGAVQTLTLDISAL